jgi:hypothetical protein
MMVDNVIDYKDYLFQKKLSSNLMVQWRANTIVDKITTTSPYAELSASGDEVTIPMVLPDPIHPYVKGAPSPVDDTLPKLITLKVDQYLDWGFPIYDVDKKLLQTKNFWQMKAKENGKALAEVSEAEVLAFMAANAFTKNAGVAAGKNGYYNFGALGGTSVQATKDNIVALTSDANTALTEAKVPADERFIVLPPWAAALYLQSDLGKVYVSGDKTSTLRTGIPGPVTGMKVYESMFLPGVLDTDGKWVDAVIFGRQGATAFWNQIKDVKTIQHRVDAHAEEMHGLLGYGRGVYREEGLGVMYLRKAA